MKKVIRNLSIMLLILSVAGCSSNGSQTIKDRAKNEVTIPNNIESIISTSPATTEVLMGLGLADKIIAVDQYSQKIEGLRSDVSVINFRNPDVEALIKLKPDMIVTSSHNASGDGDPFALVKAAGISVVTIPVSTSIDAIKEDIRFLGKITKTSSKAEQMIKKIEQDVNEITKIAKTIPADKQKTVYFEISPEPSIFAVGGNTFLNEFIEIIGAKNIFSDQDGWPKPSIESILKANPDVIITNVSMDPEAVQNIKNRAGFNKIKAVENYEVYVMDVNLTSRSSQNSIEALKQLAKLVYPEYYGQ